MRNKAETMQTTVKGGNGVLFLVLMEFKRIIVEQRHEKAKHLNTEANGFLTGTRGLVIGGAWAVFPVCDMGKG